MNEFPKIVTEAQNKFVCGVPKHLAEFLKQFGFRQSSFDDLRGHFYNPNNSEYYDLVAEMEHSMFANSRLVIYNPRTDTQESAMSLDQFIEEYLRLELIYFLDGVYRVDARFSAAKEFAQEQADEHCRDIGMEVDQDDAREIYATYLMRDLLANLGEEDWAVDEDTIKTSEIEKII